MHWNFVSGLENPDDCGTRGIPPTKLLEKCNLWFNEPDWLKVLLFRLESLKIIHNYKNSCLPKPKNKPSKLIMLNVVDATFKAEFLQKIASWNKLKRVVAYCLRFVTNCSLPTSKRRKFFLTTEELNEAENGIMKLIQRDHFPMEVSFSRQAASVE
ncbi:integrase catalytic domain-containing protein [Trichonephila clavipes]|nr:integrase catalytic domain-containing protein [Trichonephila clavipes]